MFYIPLIIRVPHRDLIVTNGAKICANFLRFVAIKSLWDTLLVMELSTQM